MKTLKDKRCLVITYGPVPTPQYQTIEGGGMRAWGLARGLHAAGARVTVAVNSSFPQSIASHMNIALTNWSTDPQFANLINTFDAVIVSYCMGSDSVFIAENINDDVQLILDVYVPIYVEVSARESEDLDNEYVHYMADVERYNRVLKRGDYFLCASLSQKIYYTGVLSALGIINPRSYREDRIIIAPFGIDKNPAMATDNPYKKLGVKDDDFLVLWFGGLYPWFRIDEFLNSVKELSNFKNIKFAIVGGKNPFNPNPAFFKQYDYAVKFAHDNKLFAKSLIFVDWVDFNDRVNWYSRADVVISINQPGEENTFAWRTRVMDFVWASLPVLTNGGDPLSEQLLAKGAAIQLEALSQETLSRSISELFTNRSILQNIKRNLDSIKPNYYWDKITFPIAKVIADGSLPNRSEFDYRKKLGVSDAFLKDLSNQEDSVSLRNPFVLSKKAFKYARRKGLKQSMTLAYKIGQTQLKKKTQLNRPRQFVFISHPIDNTGAPLVLLKMIEEFADKFGPSNVRLIAPSILPHHLKRLKQRSIRVEKAAIALSDRLIDLQLGLRPDDFILMNTLAIYPNYRSYVFRALQSERIKHAYWFIHEDIAQISLVANELKNEKEIKEISKLANSKKLNLVVPSKKVKLDYENHWHVKNVYVQPLFVDVPEEYKKVRSTSDYSKLNFLLAGTPADSRKGQLLAISAFYAFLKNYYEKSPEKYRDFSFSLVGIGEDYVSQQIKIVGELLGNRLKIHPSVPYAESLRITATCNAVVCCSLNETFALYVAEAMYMGHILLRNDSAGMAEQLEDGVNGLFIETEDIDQFVSTIEKLLNKKTSDTDLQNMGSESQRIIAPYSKNSYLNVLDIK